MEIKVSIIVPVYNVEQYLRKCLDSLIHQTLQEIEIIIVNDCSPDGSQAIIDEYVQKDGRVKSIIHRENLGLGGARNTGIDAAKGKYIAFVDSDDWMELNAYEYLYTLAEKEQVDVLSFGMNVIQGKQQTYIYQNTFNLQEKIESIPKYLKKEIASAACNKIYFRQFILTQKIYFPIHQLYEDGPWTFHVLCEAKKVVGISKVFYNYFKRSESIIKTISIKYIRDCDTSFNQMRNLLEKYNLQKFSDLLHQFIWVDIRFLYSLIITNKINENSDVFLFFYEKFSLQGVKIMHQYILELASKNQFTDKVNQRIIDTKFKKIFSLIFKYLK